MANEKLYNRYKHLVNKSLDNIYFDKRLEDDLLQEGRLGLLLAMQKADFDNLSVCIYLEKRIRGAMLRFIDKERAYENTHIEFNDNYLDSSYNEVDSDDFIETLNGYLNGRQRTVLEYRLLHWDSNQIGKEIGITSRRVNQIVVEIKQICIEHLSDDINI